MNHSLLSADRLRRLVAPLPLNRWALAYCLFAAVVAFCFQLGDIVIVGYQGYVFDDCLFHGDIQNFYLRCCECPVGSAAYDPFIFIVFGLWNLPVWLICTLLHVTPSPGITAYWSRLFVFILFLASSQIMGAIMTACNCDKLKRHAAVLFMTTPFAFFSLIILGCFDILSIILQLLGIFFLIKRKNNAFLLMFMVANCHKYLAFFTFIPLLLLTEKRFLHLIKGCLASVALVIPGILVMKWLSPAETAHRDGLNDLVIRKIFGAAYSIGFPDHGSVLILAFALLCVAAYIIRPENDAQRQRWILYLPLVAYSLLFGLIPLHAQWIVCLAPFIVFNLLLADHHQTALFLIEGVLFIAFAGICWTGCNINEQLIDICSALAYIGRFNRLYNHFTYGTERLMYSLPGLPTIALSLYHAMLIAFAALACPRLDHHHPAALNRLPPPPSYTLRRFLCVLVFIIPTAACYTLSYIYR